MSSYGGGGYGGGYGSGGYGGGGYGGGYGSSSSSGGTEKKKKSLLDRIAAEVYSGPVKSFAQFEGRLASGLTRAALTALPGAVALSKAAAEDLKHPLRGQNLSLDPNPLHRSAYRSNVEKTALDPMIKSTKEYWGHDTLKHLNEDPAQGLLDLFTIGSLGLGTASKLAKVAGSEGKLASLSEPALIETRSPRNVLSEGLEGPVQTRLTGTKVMQNARERATARRRRVDLEKTPVKVGGRIVRSPGKGTEFRQFGKGIQERVQQIQYGEIAPSSAQKAAYRFLGQDAQTALNLRSFDIHPTDLRALWEGKPAEKLLTDSVVEKMINPTKRMQAAEIANRGLSQAGADILRQRGQLAEVPEAARPDLPKRIAAESLGRPVQELHGDPYYTPHLINEIRPVNPLAAGGGGHGIPKKPRSAFKNEGTLFRTGNLLLKGNLLQPEYLRRLKFMGYDLTHDALLDASIRVTADQIRAGDGLPKEWHFVAKKPYTITRTEEVPVAENQLSLPGMRGETQTVTRKIRMNPRPSATLKKETEEPRSLAEIVPQPDDLQRSDLSKGFGTDEIDNAHADSTGHYYILPKELTKAATGEYTRMSEFAYNWLRKPLSVWRALVLGTRPAFLVNNLIGNSLMYAAHRGGTGALRDVLMAMRESHGDKFVRAALDDSSVSPALRQDLYSEFFGEQGHGTMGRTQSPSTGDAVLRAGTAVGRGFQEATGAIPRATSYLAEESLRKGAIRNLIRNSPDFRRVYQSMPHDTRSFQTAARKLLEGEGGPEYRRMISRQVDEVLGNYRKLNHTEQNVLRNLAPFYSWYKAIATTSFHLLADSPVRAHALFSLGQIGQQWLTDTFGENALPSYLLGAIPLGKGARGTNRVLATQSLNPWATLDQLRRGGTDDVTSLGLNPFLQGAFDAYKQNDGKLSAPAFLYATLAGTIGALPPVQMANPPGPSALYPNRNRNTFWEAWAGAPIKEFSPATAIQQAASGR